MSSQSADTSTTLPHLPVSHRTRTRVAAGVGAVLAAAALTLSAGPAQAAATSLRIPLSDTILTSAGPLQFTGTLHVVAYPNDPYSPNDPYFPTDPYRVHTNLIQGQVTGDALSCRVSGTPKGEAPAESPFTLSYAYSGSSACTDLGSLRLQLELFSDDDGTVTGVEVSALEGLD
jgi:hypothetical protein